MYVGVDFGELCSLDLIIICNISYMCNNNPTIFPDTLTTVISAPSFDHSGGLCRSVGRSSTIPRPIVFCAISRVAL